MLGAKTPVRGHSQCPPQLTADSIFSPRGPKAHLLSTLPSVGAKAPPYGCFNNRVDLKSTLRSQKQQAASPMAHARRLLEPTRFKDDTSPHPGLHWAGLKALKAHGAKAPLRPRAFRAQGINNK